MKLIDIKKGWFPEVKGIPAQDVFVPEKPDTVAVLPDRIPLIRPRLLVREGDSVKLGDPLFEDKRKPDFIFRSPGGGVVSEIVFGPRRVIREIIIRLDENEESVDFQMVSPDELPEMDRAKVIRLLLDGGLWPLIRELPFRGIADPGYCPGKIIVTLGSKDPYQPSPDVYIGDDEELFNFGLEIIGKLAVTMLITACREDVNFLENNSEIITHTIAGPYPSNDPGVVNYAEKESVEDNRTWFVDGQDVMHIASLFKNGKFPSSRIYSTGGMSLRDCNHVKARFGAPVNNILSNTKITGLDKVRYVAGGLFTGYGCKRYGHLGMYETSLTVLPEGDKSEFFAFVRPGTNKQSFSRTFLASLRKTPIPMHCNVNGEERACVNCSSCTRVCPVDILPQFTMKSIYADEIEQALKHGLLDCVECGLCSYVCPSKIELSETLKSAKHQYYKERA